jgi:uncharacterized membrane protein YccC
MDDACGSSVLATSRKARRGQRRLLAHAAWQLAHERGHIGPRRDLGDQLLDLALGQVFGTLQEGVAVLPRQMRRQLGDAAEVQAAVGEHREQDGVPARGARSGDPKVGFRLREMQDVDAVAEHRRRRKARIEASPIDLTDVGDEVRLGATRPRSGPKASQLPDPFGDELRPDGVPVRFESTRQPTASTPTPNRTG